MRARRRRKGLDEVRKRELREDLRNYFINSKNLNYSNGFSKRGLGFKQDNSDQLSEAAVSSADTQLDPQSQLDKARESNYNFGDISISNDSQSEQLEEKQGRLNETPEPRATQKEDRENESESPKSERKNREQNRFESQTDTSGYSRYQLEQMEREKEQRQKEAQTAQNLVDLPAALESDNRELGHSVKAFADPFLILKELLWMAGRQNPELDVIQRLWLVWRRWYTYYSAWFSVNNQENRFLPGSNRDFHDRNQQRSTYQYRGIHELQTCHLESSILQIMRWEFARKTQLERQFNPIPTVSQLHGYFVGLKRRHWDSTSWQYRVNLGTYLTMDEDDKQLQFSSNADDEE